MIITKLIIYVDRDETEIEWQIAREVLSGRSHMSVQIDNGSARGFGCVIGHGRKDSMVSYRKASTVVTGPLTSYYRQVRRED